MASFASESKAILGLKISHKVMLIRAIILVKSLPAISSISELTLEIIIRFLPCVAEEMKRNFPYLG